MRSRRRTPDTVCVVHKEPGCAGIYRKWLSEYYRVRVANSDDEALQIIDDGVSVVLLVHRGPGLSGTEILAQIDRGDPGCPVALLTAVEPAMDVLDLGFDAYLVKPVDRAEVVDLVRQLIRRRAFSETIHDLFSISTEKAAFETRYDRERLAGIEEYRRLRSEYTDRRASISDAIDDFGADDFVKLFEEIDPSDGSTN